MRPQRPTTACKHTVSGTLSLPSPGCFSPFPHGTCSLSVASEYLALEDGPPRFPRGCTCLAVLGNCLQEGERPSLTGLSPSTVPLSSELRLTTDFLTVTQAGRPETVRPTTPNMQPLPGITHAWFSLIRFRSPLLTESQLFSLPAGTEMFHFPAFPPTPYEFRRR